MDTGWKFSDEHGDYYRYEYNPEKNEYVIVWGRGKLPPPESAPPLSAPNAPRLLAGEPFSDLSYPNHPVRPDYPYEQHDGTSDITGYPSTEVSNVSSGLGGHYQAKDSTVAIDDQYTNDPGSDDEDQEFGTTSAQEDSRYQQIREPKRYFKKGRVFMVQWVSPQASGTNPRFEKIRRFVVVRTKSGHCLCLPIHTYSGRGTAKEGINADDHAPLVLPGQTVQLAPNERPLKKEPLSLIVEDNTVNISPYSRIDFSKIFPVEHNLKVRTIGRIDPAYLARLEEYFRSGIGIAELTEE